MIVGGGIGGAVLALVLGQRGHRVMLLERDLNPHAIGRPEILAQATMDVFDQLGVGERIKQEAALPLRGLELWRAGGQRLLALTADEFRSVGAQPYSTDPARTRQILLEEAEALPSVQLKRGVEVDELLQEGQRVVGVRAHSSGEHFSISACLVIGDDGGRSRVRECLGIPLKTATFPLDFLCAAGPMLPGQSEGVGQAWIQPDSIRNGIFGGIFLPLPASRTALVFLLSSRAYEDFARQDTSRLFDAAARLSPRCESLAKRYRFPEDFACLRRPFGHAPAYVADGAALLGDAVHPVTPAGGQGANMSVADAVVLADVAHEALKIGDCSKQRLARYETIRRPANQRSLQFSARTARVLRVLRLCPWLAPLVTMWLGSVDRQPQMKRRLVRAVSQAFRSQEN